MLVGIGDYLPQMIGRMTRKDETKFHFLHVTEEVLLRREIIKKDMLELDFMVGHMILSRRKCLMRLRLNWIQYDTDYQ